LSGLSPLVTLPLNPVAESQIFVSVERVKLVSTRLINNRWLDVMTRKGKLRSTGDSSYESHLQDAIKGLQDGSFLTISEAARKSRVRCRLCDVGRNTTYYSFQVARQTLQNRFKGQTVSRHKAAEKAQNANNSGSHSEPSMMARVPAASLLPTPSCSYSSSVPLNQLFYHDLSSYAGSSHVPMNVNSTT
jgi:hypothetical protein